MPLRDSLPSMRNRLSKERISTSIDNICSNGLLKDEFLDLHGLKIERISDWNPVLAKAKCASNSKEYSQGCTPWHFGLSIFDREGGLVGFVSFNVAYSSWSGRILYMDQMHLDEGIFSDDVDVLLLRLLAKLAIEWDCARLTWRHDTTPAWHSMGKNQPEMHGEVLTLSLDEVAMTTFVGHDFADDDISIMKDDFSRQNVSTAIMNSLKLVTSGQSTFRLRLAKECDLTTIERLVQNLADYVKEPDAVEMTAKDYLDDGFKLNDPLWYCVLIDRLNDDGKLITTCGYAFVFVGYVLGQGRFLYLEDLYIDSEYRGGGGGKMTMKALATMCLSMQCTHLYWQALDWNVGSLKFYESIGAKIHVGEKTSRYAGETLKVFSNDGID